MIIETGRMCGELKSLYRRYGIFEKDIEDGPLDHIDRETPVLKMGHSHMRIVADWVRYSDD